MKSERKNALREWWRFSARERRALLYLLPILALASWLVYEIARPRFRDSFTEYADSVNAQTAPPSANNAAAAAVDSLFEFDPNTIEYHELCRLGFSRGEALGIVKYREHGKVFEIPEDFASCYQVSEEMYRRLEPFIIIGEKYRLKPRRANEAGGADGGYGTSRKASAEWEPAPFSLDTVSAATLRRMGFSARQAEALLNYRDMKGGLRSAEEFAECYVVSDEMFARLEPWLLFPAKQAGRAPDVPVNLNRADSAALRSVRGIGEKTVVTIMEYRERLGGFCRPEQLAEVPGVTEQNYERIVQQIFVDSCDIQKIDVNFATAKELGSHPYIGNKALRKLLKLRQLKGGWSNTGELIEDKIFTSDEAEKVAPYLLFGVSEQQTNQK